MRNVWRSMRTAAGRSGVVSAIAVLAAGAVVAACSVTTTDSASSFESGRSAGDNAGAAGPGGVPGESGGSSAAPPSTGTTGDTAGSSGANGEAPQAGQLTAGVWDDNLNFDFFQKYLQRTSGLAGVPSFGIEERTAARDRALAPRAAVAELDIAFLVDTTGSMGDELRYLQSELSAIASTVAEKFPGTAPRFGLVFYRDHGDAYLTRHFDFTTDLATVQANLDAQGAAGGGDYPEAVPEALAQANALSWRTGPVARLTFWVADAPQHDQDAAAVKAAIGTAVQKDMHVYPVAASGASELTEATMRSAAQLTGGRYLFLTDDSGVGNAHKEPSIPCYHVTRFDGALVRMVESEMSGTHVQPTASEIVRTVGSPTEGRCTLASQEQVVIY